MTHYKQVLQSALLFVFAVAAVSAMPPVVQEQLTVSEQIEADLAEFKSVTLPAGKATIILDEPIDITLSDSVLNLNGRLLQAPGFGLAIRLEAPKKADGGTVMLRRCRVENGRIRGRIEAKNITDCAWEDLYIYSSSSGSGLTLDRAWRNTIHSVKSQSHQMHGLLLKQANSPTITGGSFSGNFGNGIHLEDSSVCAAFFNPTVEGNRGWGFGFSRGDRGQIRNLNVSGCYMEGNKLGGVNFTERSPNYSISFTGCRLDTPVRIYSMSGVYLNNAELSHLGTTPDGTKTRTAEVNLTGNGWLTMTNEGHYLKSPPFSHQVFNVFGIKQVVGD